MTDEKIPDDPSESATAANEIEIEIDADAIGEDVDGESIDRAMKDALDAVEQIRGRESDPGPEKGIAALRPEGVPPESDEDVDALRAEIADLKDRTVRTLADFDNYRKRVDRERQEERRYASTGVLREALGVVDNMERALDSSGSVEDLKAGVAMILRQLQELLRVEGVCAVEAEGAKFDPVVHDAVSQVTSSEVDVPMVDSVLQKGYTLHERLLRPAMVVVAMPDPAGADGAVGDDGADDPDTVDHGGGE